MAQGWCAKNIERAKRNGIRRNGNTFKGVVARTTGSTFAERKQAFEEYKKLLHGAEVTKNVIYATSDGLVVGAKIASIGSTGLVGRDGTGLPTEGYDDVKYSVAVVIPADEIKKPKRTSQGNAKVSSKGSMVVSAPTVAKWSRRGGFAAR